MKTGITILFASLLLGQLGAINLGSGVVVYIHDIVVVGFLVCLAIAGAKQKKVRRPTLFWPIVTFGSVAVVSLLLNISRFSPGEIGASSLYAFRWIVYAGLYLVLVQQKRFAPYALKGLFITGSAFSILGLMQYALYPNLRNLWYLGWDPHQFRLFSTFLDPNFAGLFIVLTFLLGLAWPKKAPWLWTLQGMNLLALYLTYSRGSYLAMFAAGVIWIILEKRWQILWFMIAAILLVLVIPRPGGDTLRLLRADSTVARLVNWQQAGELVTRAPLLGYGFNTLRFVPRPSVTSNIDKPVSKAAAGVDNSFLFLLATTGIVGLGVYLWLLRKSMSISKTHVAILVAVIVHSQFTNSLFYPWIMLWLWMYWGANEASGDR